MCVGFTGDSLEQNGLPPSMYSTSLATVLCVRVHARVLVVLVVLCVLHLPVLHFHTRRPAAVCLLCHPHGNHTFRYSAFCGVYLACSFHRATVLSIDYRNNKCKLEERLPFVVG